MHIFAPMYFAESHCKTLRRQNYFQVCFSGAPHSSPKPLRYLCWGKSLCYSSQQWWYLHISVKPPSSPCRDSPFPLGLKVVLYSPFCVSESLHILYLVWPRDVGSKLHQAGLFVRFGHCSIPDAQVVLLKDRDFTGEELEVQRDHLAPKWRDLLALSLVCSVVFWSTG